LESSVIVIGGGVAGIAAAVRLAQEGVKVTLVEARNRLGGRATSFTDAVTGETLDNCQHVVLRCCTNLLDLYEKLGVVDTIEWHRKFYFCDGDGRIDTLEANDLPAPFHLTRALWGFTTFNLLEKLAISRAMGALMRVDRTAWHQKSFAQWLTKLAQPPSVVEKFWAPVVVSALNELPDRIAGDYAIQVFQEAFLANNTAYEMGLPGPGVPLVRLYDAAERVISDAGGQVLMNTAAQSLAFDGHRITSLNLANGESLSADKYISALTFDRLEKLCDKNITQCDPRLQHLTDIHVSPIIGFHLWFDRNVTDLPHLTLTQSPLQWIFNKAVAADGSKHPASQGYLHCVISAAHELVNHTSDDLTDMAVREIRKALPATNHVKLLRARIVKEKLATFSLTPGLDVIRPSATGLIDNLHLAGDWTQSGWPATMEGACRSGYYAAGAVLGRDDLLADELPASWFYRTISSRST